MPLGAVLDDGRKTGVWVVDSATSTVRFQPVKTCPGERRNRRGLRIELGAPIVSLGAHLLQDGARVRIASKAGGKL